MYKNTRIKTGITNYNIDNICLTQTRFQNHGIIQSPLSNHETLIIYIKW